MLQAAEAFDCPDIQYVDDQALENLRRATVGYDAMRKMYVLQNLRLSLEDKPCGLWCDLLDEAIIAKHQKLPYMFEPTVSSFSSYLIKLKDQKAVKDAERDNPKSEPTTAETFVSTVTSLPGFSSLTRAYSYTLAPVVDAAAPYTPRIVTRYFDGGQFSCETFCYDRYCQYKTGTVICKPVEVPLFTSVYAQINMAFDGIYPLFDIVQIKQIYIKEDFASYLGYLTPVSNWNGIHGIATVICRYVGGVFAPVVVTSDHVNMFKSFVSHSCVTKKASGTASSTINLDAMKVINFGGMAIYYTKNLDSSSFVSNEETTFCNVLNSEGLRTLTGLTRETNNKETRYIIHESLGAGSSGSPCFAPEYVESLGTVKTITSVVTASNAFSSYAS